MRHNIILDMSINYVRNFVFTGYMMIKWVFFCVYVKYITSYEHYINFIDKSHIRFYTSVYLGVITSKQIDKY